MNGLRVATLAVGMMLVVPFGAAAQQACMCAETGLELPLSELDAELLQGALDEQGRDALLVSRDEPSGKLAAAQPDDNEDLPWCTSQNDPQCSKLPAGSVPSPMSIDASPSVALRSLLALPSPSSVTHDFAEYSRGGPRDAVRLQLERPPQ